ncbi:CRISPR type III-a/mtube-associated ramp protein csm4, partial [Mycobacterium tuberculosis KT-0102]
MNSRLFRFDFDRTHFGDHGLESSTISCPADTLYSALCVEALRMGGQQLLGELVACSTLRLTDLLPYVGPDYLVPKPLHSVRSDGSSMQKKLAKKIGFLPAAQLGSFLDGTADLNEPPRHVRRLQFLERMGSCQVVHRGGTRRSCVSGRCGWSQRSAVSTIRSGQRSVR